MSDFDDFYNLFQKTPVAKHIVQQIESAHPTLSHNTIEKAAKDMAGTAFLLADEGYFSLNPIEGAVSKNWNSLFRSISAQSPEYIETARNFAKDYALKIMPLCKNSTEASLARAVFYKTTLCLNNYKPQLIDKPTFSKRLLESSYNILSNKKMSLKDKYSLALFAFSGMYKEKPDDFIYRLDMINEAIKKIDNPQKLSHICTEIDISFINEGKITAETAKGFKENYLPFVNAVGEFSDLAAEHDCKTGEYGMMGYLFKAHSEEWNSPNLCEMMYIAREVPTTDMIERKMIREAAIILDKGSFPGLRDAIHSESIGVNKLLHHMSNYYSAVKQKDNKTSLQEKKNIAFYLHSYEMDEFLEEYCDIKNYEEVLDKKNKLKAIEFINLCRSNSRDNKPPLCGDVTLDVLVQKFSLTPSSENLWEEPVLFGLFLKKLNKKIMQNIDRKKSGFDPKLINLLLWCDKKAALILKSRPDFEAQCGDYKTEWFKEFLRFSELTANPNYENENFETYFDILQSMGPEAYKRIAERQVKNIRSGIALSEQKEEAVLDNWRQVRKISGEIPDEFAETSFHKIFHTRRENLWSGLLLKETISTVGNFKKPSTRIGERYLKKTQNKICELPLEDKLLKLFNDHKRQK